MKTVWPYPKNDVMLAPNELVPLDKIKWPMYSSPKLDGIYCMVYKGQLYSRGLKLIPNQKLKKKLSRVLERDDLVFFGEIWSPKMAFPEISSIVRSFTKPIPDCLRFWCFDLLTVYEYDYATGGPRFEIRNNELHRLSASLDEGYMPVPQALCNTAHEAQLSYSFHLSLGCEGSILKRPSSYYKHGRCTTRESIMFKLKKTVTHDARITAILPAKRMRDGVPRDRGLTSKLNRPHRKEFFECDNKLGSFEVELENGTRCKVGPGKGLTNVVKRQIWENRDAYIGKIIEFESLDHGVKDKPRMGKFVRFRDDKGQDISTRIQESV